MKKKENLSVLALLAILAILPAGRPVRAQDDAMAKVTRGWNALKEGKLKEAKATFQSLLDASPNYDFAWYALGQVAIREKKLDEAISHFKKAIEINPKKFDYAYGLSATYRAKKEYAKAIATLNNSEELAQTKQSRYLLHLERGLSYSSLRQHDRAVADLREAVKLQPADKRANQTLGISLVALEKYQDAIPPLETAVKAGPKDSVSQYYLARALINAALEQRDKTAKAALYKKAVTAASASYSVRSSTDTLSVLARAQLGAKQFSGAVKSFGSLVKARPKSCTALFNLGQAHLGAQNWKGASAALEKASACDPKNTLILSSLGFAYLKLKALDKSLAAYEKAYAIKSTPVFANKIADVKKRIQVMAENERIEKENAAALAQQKAEEEEYARKKAAYEEEQRKLKAYEKAKDN
ncbi:MAG: tetratricopeptide repeat protein [Acidobacteriota bacterium]